MEDRQIVLEIDGVRLECSQNSLAQASDYFQAMFHGSFIENNQNVIHLKDINPSDMQLTLSLIDQKDKLDDLNVNQALGVLQISSMFQFHNLQTLIESHLSKDLLNVESCLYIAQAAEMLLVPNLTFRATMFSFWEFTQVQHTETFLDLQLEDLKKYLSSDALFTPDGEMETFEAAVRWISHNKCTDILEVLKCVRFHLLNTDDLNIILKTDVINANPFMSEVITSISDSKTPNRDEKHHEGTSQENCSRSNRSSYAASCEVINFVKQLNTKPRKSPLAPCFAGYVTHKGQSPDTQSKPKMLVFCFDAKRKDKLYPFLSIEHDAVGCAIASRDEFHVMRGIILF